MNDGQIVEQGRHSELHRNHGFYRRICDEQLLVEPPIGANLHAVSGHA